METFNFDSKIGASKEMDLMFDGEKRATFRVYPMIPFALRASTIQSVIDSVVDEGAYMPYNYHFALAYNLIQSYTDIVFPDIELDDIDGESDADHRARQRNANLSSAFEFIQRTNVLTIIQENIVDFADIVKEVNMGIKFAAKQKLTNTSWSRVGDKIQDLFDTLGAAFEDTDIVNGFVSAVTAAIADTEDANT